MPVERPSRMIAANIAVVPLLLGLAGCFSHGAGALKAVTRSNVEQNLTQRKTTKQDVLALYGPPTSKEIKETGDIWKYSLVSTQISPESFLPVINLFAVSGSNQGKFLTITFDQSGVLKDYTFSESADSFHKAL